MGEKKNTLKNPAFGQISISRVYYGKANTRLYGSAIPHRETISLSIRESEVTRDLHHDFFHAGKELVEIELSPNQWAELVSSIGVGEGVPCTIRHINGEKIPAIPEETSSEQEKIEKEFSEKNKAINEIANTLIADVETLLREKRTTTKADREALLQKLQQLKTEIGPNMDFLEKSFADAMDKTTHEAKAELEAFAIQRNYLPLMNKVALIEAKQTENDCKKNHDSHSDWWQSVASVSPAENSVRAPEDITEKLT